MARFELTNLIEEHTLNYIGGDLGFYGSWVAGRPDAGFDFESFTEKNDWLTLTAKNKSVILKIRHPQEVKTFQDRVDVMFAKEIYYSFVEESYLSRPERVNWTRFQSINGKVLYTTNANDIERVYKDWFNIHHNFPALTFLKRGEGEAWEKCYSCYPQNSVLNND